MGNGLYDVIGLEGSYQQAKTTPLGSNTIYEGSPDSFLRNYGKTYMDNNILKTTSFGTDTPMNAVEYSTWASKNPELAAKLGNSVQFDKNGEQVGASTETNKGLGAMDYANIGLGVGQLAASYDAQKESEKMARKNYGLKKDELDVRKADIGWKADTGLGGNGLGTTAKSRTRTAMSSAF